MPENTERGEPRTERTGVPPPVAAQVFKNGGWVCYWCEMPVIFHPAFKYLQLYVESRQYKEPLAYYDFRFARTRAPMLDELAAVVDHKVPVSKGGSNRPENLVTSCNKCNILKSNLDGAEWEKVRKGMQRRRVLDKPPRRAPAWDGFVSLFIVMLRDNPRAATASEKEWYEALTCQQVIVRE